MYLFFNLIIYNYFEPFQVHTQMRLLYEHFFPPYRLLLVNIISFVPIP